MAEHDYVIANDSGANLRADLNNALQAIVTLNAKATEPTAKFAYMLWLDTTAGELKIRNAANTAWIAFAKINASDLELIGLKIRGTNFANLAGTGALALQHGATLGAGKTLSANTGFLSIGTSSGNLTIASGAITITGSRHAVDTEGSAARDELNTIVGGEVGTLLLLAPVASLRMVVIKSGEGSGNDTIRTIDGRPIQLSNLNHRTLLVRHSGGWNEIASWSQAGDVVSPRYLAFGTLHRTETIASGAMTIRTGMVNIDTEDAAATDDLDTITWDSDTQPAAQQGNGALVLFQPADASRTVVMKHGTGNLNLAGDFVMSESNDQILLRYSNGAWFEVWRYSRGRIDPYGLDYQAHTIASDAVALRSRAAVLTSQSGTADGLATLTVAGAIGAGDGARIRLRAAATHTITLNETGNIRVNGGTTYALSGDNCIELERYGSNWYECWRSNH